MSQYQNMKFADYEFREYPKWIPTGKTGKDGNPLGVTVHNEDEELAVLTEGKPLVREEDEKARLLKLCDVKGVQADKRWGVERLEAALVAEGHDPSFDPNA